MIVWPAKPAAAIEKFAFDFTGALGGGTVVGNPLITADGVILDDSEVAGGVVRLLISGGTEGTVAKVSCSIVTSGGETIPALAVLEIGGEAVSLAAAKLAQRIDDDEEDELLAGFLRAAIGHIETATGKKLTPKIVTQRVDGFPHREFRDPIHWRHHRHGEEPVRLWFGPASEILSVDYDDPAGNAQTLSSFRLVPGATARLLPAYGQCWPRTAHGPGTVRLTYVAGYDPTALPPALVQAAILLFGHFNANRDAVLADARAAAVEIPLGVETLIEPHRAVPF